MSPKVTRSILAALLALGALLRFYGLWWAFPFGLHCDETSLIGAATRLARNLSERGVPDPDFSVWGALPLYLAWLGTLPVRLLAAATGHRFETTEALLISGRSISALADTVSILLVYWLAARRSLLAGLIAAGLYTVALIAVRESHFFSVDSLACCLLLVYVATCVRLSEDPSPRWWTWCGLSFGVCLAAKISSLPMAGLLLATFCCTVWQRSRRGGDPKNPELSRAVRRLRGLLLALALTAAVPAVLWSLQRPHLIAYGRQALVEKTPKWRLDQHSMEFWESQVDSIYRGGLHFTVGAAVGMALLCGAGLMVTLSVRGPRYAYETWVLLPNLLRAAVVAAATFAALNPMAVLTPARYWLPSDPYRVTWAMLQVSGALQPPPGWTIQFLGTVPVWYQLVHVLPYAWGPGLMPLLLMSLVWGGVQVFRGCRSNQWILACAAFLSTVTLMTLWMKMARYALPVTPLACALAGILLASALERPKWRRLTAAGTVLAFLVSLAWSASYVTSIYGHVDGRVAAAQWLKENARPQEQVVLEKDDAWGVGGEIMLDQAIPGPMTRYNPLQVMHDLIGSPVTEEAEREKQRYLEENLRGATYLVLTDNNPTRLARLANHFPVINRFYSELFSGRTDFELVATFGPQWQLFGWPINDAAAEPTFRLFDHPRVFIFKRRSPPSPAPEPSGSVSARNSRAPAALRARPQPRP